VVNTAAVVEHNVTLGAFAQAGPAVAIGGGARIGDGSYLGLAVGSATMSRSVGASWSAWVPPSSETLPTERR